MAVQFLLQQMLGGAMPGIPDVAIPIVDVRDVAAAHIAAIDAPGAVGQRILLASQGSATPMSEIGALLRSEFGQRASKVPTRRIPSFVLRAAARFRPELRGVAPELGYVKRLSTARQRDLLGIDPRPWQEAVVSGGARMLDRGLVG